MFASHEPHLVERVATRVVRLGGDRDPVRDDAEPAEAVAEPGGKQPVKQQQKPKQKPKPSHGRKKR